MSIVFLFGGQGPDLARLGPDLARVGERTSELLELAAHHAGLPLQDIWARGGRALERTEVYQPVLIALELGLHNALEAGGVQPVAVAGHSLGELSAWSAAGGIPAEDAVCIAAERGRMMAERGAACPGGLLALEADVGQAMDSVLELGEDHGGVYVAAMNAPSEWVIGGSDGALRAIARRFPSTRLTVEGPWHGPPMLPVVEPFRRFLDAFVTHPLRTVIVSSRSGSVATSEAMPGLISDQLIHPVCWAEALTALVEVGASQLVTVGPGKVMRGLAHRNGLGHLIMHSTDTPTMLARTIEALGTR